MQINTDKNQKEQKEHGSFAFPFLLSYERLSSYETGSFLWHWHPEAEITLITSGQMEYHVNDQVFHAKEGDVIFCSGGALHAGNMVGGDDCSYNAITFDPKLIYGYKESSIYSSFISPIIHTPSFGGIYYAADTEEGNQIHELICHLSQVAEEKEAGYELSVCMDLTSFWQILWKDFSELHLEQNDNYRRNYERIRSIISFIEEHYQEKITLEDVADAVHLSRSECSRIFKYYMQQSLFGFIQQYRIQKSLGYLLDTNASIMEIAELVGIPDSNYFAKTFTKVQGVSPTAYRKHREIEH